MVLIVRDHNGMKKVIVSAPGKLHISGEHAVVYGKPTLIMATTLRMYVTLEKTTSPLLSTIRESDAYIDAIVGLFEKKYGLTVDSDMRLGITSAIPIRSGMGSSAALAVSLNGALYAWHGLSWNAQSINELAYQAEKTKHENSSGGDPAVSTHGGILWYRKELEFLKTLWLLPFKVPKAFAPIVLINTGREENTGDLVRHVMHVKKNDESRFAALLSAIEMVTKDVTKSIHDEDEAMFRAAIQKNEELLEEMEVVSSSVTSFIQKIKSAGGVAKISGAGGKKKGSGVVLATHDNPRVLVELAKKYGYPSFQVGLGGEGIRLEQVLT